MLSLVLFILFVRAVLFCLHFQHGVRHFGSLVSSRGAAHRVIGRTIWDKGVRRRLVLMVLTLDLFTILRLAFVDRREMWNFIMEAETSWTHLSWGLIIIMLRLTDALANLHIRHVDLNYLFTFTLWIPAFCRDINGQLRSFYETGRIVIFDLRRCLLSDIHCHTSKNNLVNPIFIIK